MLKEPKHRIRWLTREEATRLLSFLPTHIEVMARFALATDLRKSNVTGLQWSQIYLDHHVGWIHADQAKAGRSIAVPLNADAYDVLVSPVG